MTKDIDRLYDLLPVVYRQRDAEQGWPLKALLRVIAEQVNIVEDDMDQLYENWFLETCQDWVVPYIGDLVGYRAVHEAGQPGDVDSAQGQALNKILIPRREVANTIHYRRRKGTLALLELLAAQVAGWPHSRAVEFYTLLAGTQALNHLRLERGRTADLRQSEALDNLDGPFDRMAHTVDVRRPNSRHMAGRFNIPSAGLFIWRLKSYSITQAEAYCLERKNAKRFTFSVLGNDCPLYTRYQPDRISQESPEELNYPVRISRYDFERHMAQYYGSDKSLQVWTGKPPQAVPIEAVVAADLSDWGRYQPEEGQVAIDPELGRMLFRSRKSSQNWVWATYHYGFSADLGGGEYGRAADVPDPPRRYRVALHDRARAEFESLTQALSRWEKEKPASAVIEIIDSDVYSEQIDIKLRENQSLVIRAANQTRPVVWQENRHPSLADAFSVAGQAGSNFTLDGVMIAGRPLRVSGPLRLLHLRHVTLVPGWTLGADCEPEQANEYSLELEDTAGTRVTIEHSIVGSMLVNLNEVATEPIPILMTDSILDATDPGFEALGAPEWPLAHAVLTVKRCTVIGSVQVHAIDLAENSIFDGLVRVGRRQRGCMRFCYVMPGSRPPRRYNCQPDLVEQAVKEEYPKPDWEAALAREQRRVRPQFRSRRYGTPAYARLADTCAEEIRRGADDESEMGAFHDLFEPQRATNLRARLQEYTPAGMDIGIFYAS